MVFYQPINHLNVTILKLQGGGNMNSFIMGVHNL